jgi:hypothetical protein
MRWLALAVLLAGCTGGATVAPDRSTATTQSPVMTPATSPRAAVPVRATVRVEYRIELRTTAPDFAAVVERTLTDRRGWQLAGFTLVRTPHARYVVVLAEAAEVDRLCRPYDTYGKYSCQNGPVVALNADRWRTATPEWTGDLPTYRQMLVNHEFGHLLGQHHPPSPQCPVPGRPALVMSQQSTELNGCRPNPWPLPAEIARATRHDQPLAPAYER